MIARPRDERNHLGDRRDAFPGSGAVCQADAVMARRTYRLEIESELTDLVRSELDATALSYEHGNTVLEAVVRDQSELQGLLQRLSGLGLTLVSVEMVHPGSGAKHVPAERTP